MRVIFLFPFILIELSDIILRFLILAVEGNVDSHGQMVALGRYHQNMPAVGGARGWQSSVGVIDSRQWPGVLSGLKSFCCSSSLRSPHLSLAMAWLYLLLITLEL